MSSCNTNVANNRETHHSHRIFNPSPKRRSPLASHGKRKALASKHQRAAVLPKRSHTNRLCKPAIQNPDLGQSLVQGNSASGCPEKPYLNVNSPRNELCGSGISNAINSTTLIRQLNVLKRGGYWKHLQPERTYMRGDYEQHCEADEPQEISISNRKDESKENRVHANRQWNNSDDDDEEHHERESFIGSAFVTKHDEQIEFAVHSITPDGWVCRRSSTESRDKVATEELLLHLPAKVAALGREGMRVRGIDLMTRRNNGVLEPHTHRSSSCRGCLSTTTGDLFGWII